MGDPLQPIHQAKEKTNHKLISVSKFVILLVSVFLLRDQLNPTKKIVNAKGLTWEEVAYIDEDGEPQLKEWRTKKLQKQIEELGQAEQYVLLALEDGAYLCYQCSGGTCYLKKGMVWKYGVTRKGMANRYTGKWFARKNLGYLIQFRGTFQQCLIEEKRKIVHYPLHPDNLHRSPTNRMARPPGNKNDN